MDEINKCYEILRVSPNTSYRKIRKSYNSLMLKYHPSKPEGRYKRGYFVDIVLAFDLISKIEKYSTDFSRSNAEIYIEWVNVDRAFAIAKAEQYAKLKYRDFEKEFLPGCFGLIKGFVYIIYFFLALLGVIYPINEYYLGHISGWWLFYISFALTMPLFIRVYRTIREEGSFLNRIWLRLILKLKLHKLIHKKVTPANTQYKKLGD